MNSRQKTILGWGITAFLILGVVPPHKKTADPWPETNALNMSAKDRAEGKKHPKTEIESMAYRLIWLPRTVEETSFVGYNPLDAVETTPRVTRYQVDTTLLIIHWVVVGAATAALIFLSSNSKSSDSLDVGPTNATTDHDREENAK